MSVGTKSDDTFLESIAEQVCVVAYVFDFYRRAVSVVTDLARINRTFT